MDRWEFDFDYLFLFIQNFLLVVQFVNVEIVLFETQLQGSHSRHYAHTIAQFVLSTLSHLYEPHLTQIYLHSPFLHIKWYQFLFKLLPPFPVLTVHVQKVFLININELQLLTVMGQQVYTMNSLVFSPQKWCTFIICLKRNRRSHYLRRSFFADLSKTFSLCVLCSDDLIKNLILRKRESMNENELISFHHEKNMEFEIRLKLLEVD